MPWHFKYSLKQQCKLSFSIFWHAFYVPREKVFTPAKAVPKYVLHLCTLLGPSMPLIPHASCLLEGRTTEGSPTPFFYPAREGLPLLLSLKHQPQRCSKDEERKEEGHLVSHVPLEHNGPCTGQMQGYGKSLFAGLEGCGCSIGQMVCQQQAKRDNLLESSVVQRFTIKDIQRPGCGHPCYLICACLFMCHVHWLPVGVEDV